VGAVSAASAQRWADAAAPLHSLEAVVHFGLAQTPGRFIHDVVVQDEYTHDVVLEVEGAVLVFDTT
jgi:hypothetical protein